MYIQNVACITSREHFAFAALNVPLLNALHIRKQQNPGIQPDTRITDVTTSGRGSERGKGRGEKDGERKRGTAERHEENSSERTPG